MCLSLVTVYCGASGENQINYDKAKARDTLASMSGHVSGFCMTTLFVIKNRDQNLYLIFFFYMIIWHKIACISHPLATSTKVEEVPVAVT